MLPLAQLGGVPEVFQAAVLSESSQTRAMQNVQSSDDPLFLQLAIAFLRASHLAASNCQPRLRKNHAIMRAKYWTARYAFSRPIVVPSTRREWVSVGCSTTCETAADIGSKRRPCESREYWAGLRNARRGEHSFRMVPPQPLWHITTSLSLLFSHFPSAHKDGFS